MSSYHDKDDEFSMEDNDTSSTSDFNDDFSSDIDQEVHPVESEGSSKSDIVYGLVLIGILVALSYGLYKVYDAYFSSPVPQKVVQKVDDEQTQAKDAELQEALAQSNESHSIAKREREKIQDMVNEANQTADSIATEGERRDKEIQALESQLEKQISSQDTVSNRISALTSEIAGLRQQLEQLKDNNTNLEDQLARDSQLRDTLMKEITRMDSLQKEQSAAINLLIERTTKREPVVSVPKETYTLVAALEGRAWIEDSRNRSMTVRVGDTLKDYGTVESIDPVLGKVRTSSGRVIEARQF